jgi:D-glycero-alpha-D-manno-heptose-7-phosphate kinase
MIITRTPLRVSFFGGGTDYPAWFQEHGGAVLATTIDKYLYLHCRRLPPFFDFHSRIVWSRIEAVQKHSEIAHPAIRGVLEWMKIDEGVEIHHHGDLPARTGLGSSSAFTVGLLHALHALRGELVSKRTLAEQAIFVEQQLLRENVGVQDQIQSAFGGVNRIDIRPDGSFEVAPVVIAGHRLGDLQKHLLLIYTGLSRTASDIAAEQVSTMKQRAAELKAIRAMVDHGQGILVGKGSLLEFGRLLHEGWELKRRLSSKIAPALINEVYDCAREAGAVGGKLLGAGGGGFMLLFVEPDRRAAVIRALGKLLVVPFQFERGGTQIVLYEAEHYDGNGNGATPGP